MNDTDQVLCLTQSPQSRFRPSNNLWCFETYGCLPPRIKWSTTQNDNTQTNLSLSLSLTQMIIHKLIFSLGEFLQSFFFHEEGLWIYILLNRHIVLGKTVVYKLIDSKKKYYYYYLDKKISSHMPKVQPNVQLMNI